MKANCCGFELVGADWGFLDGQESADTCRHVTGERRCDSCSRNWYREGNKSTHDYEESFSGHISGGASFEDCPECVAANEEDKARVEDEARRLNW